MARYNVNVAWDDPYDRPVNRRVAPRYELRIKLSIEVGDEGRRGRLVGPGLVHNISYTGAYLVTKHRLAAGQRIGVAIPTDMCPAELYLPSVFMGPAEVVRVEPDEDGRMCAALRFGEALAQNMDFTLFIQTLLSVTQAATAR